MILPGWRVFLAQVTSAGLDQVDHGVGEDLGVDAAESLIFFALAGFVLSSSSAITMAMGQSYMPRNLGMASGLILGLSMGMGGIGTTILGWVTDQWGLQFTLHIIFILPLLSLLTFLFVPYPPRH